MRRATYLHAALALALVACSGPALSSREADAANRFALVVHPVAWNATHAAVGKVRAVADDQDVVAVFADDGVTVLRAGAVTGHDATARAWSGAAVIPAVDGGSRWIVGFDRKGHLYSLRGLSTFGDVSDRYGLDGLAVRGVAVVDARSTKPLVGFALDGEVAVADGIDLTRYASITASAFSAGGSIAASASSGGVDVVDVRARTTKHFALDGAKYVAVTPDGVVYAATARAVYASDGQKLSLLYDADRDSIHGLVASGPRVWLADDAMLGVIEDGRVAETTTKLVAKDAVLAPSSSGDVWVIAEGALERFARTDVDGAGAAPSPEVVWQGTIQSVFARACASCHLPGGVSGTDLSTSEDWMKEKSAIHERVVVKKTMPPAGHSLSDADRDAIRAWVEQAQP